MSLRARLAALAEGLAVDLADVDDAGLVFGYHAGRIRACFAEHPGLVVNQDSVAGFLHGFLMAGAVFVADGSLEQQAMYPVLGGVLLAGRDLPLGDAADDAGNYAADDAEDDAASRAVLAELAAAAPAAVTTHDLAMVGHAFAFAGDIPMTCASLAGFCLAVRYAEPYLPHADPGAQALITAAYYLANPPNNP